MKTRFDVVIIGGGAVGSAAAFFLCKLAPQLKVLLLEKADDLGGGATGSWGSLLRVFSTLPQVSERATLSLPHFARFSEKVGEPLIFNQTGSLYFFKSFHRPLIYPRFEFISKVAQSPIEFIEFEEGRLRFPGYQWMPGDFAIYEVFAGFVEPASAVWGWTNAAIKRGLSMMTRSKVEEIRASGSGDAAVGVRLAEGSLIEAKSIVLAMGPWMMDSVVTKNIEPLPLLRVPIQINRYRSLQPLPDRMPFFLDSETGSFGRIEGSDVLGGYVEETLDSSDAFRQPMSFATSAESKRRLSKRLKWLRTADMVGGIRAVETYTKDFMPITGFSRRLKNVYIASGWCCSGFMLAPSYGEEIARAIADLHGVKVTANQ